MKANNPKIKDEIEYGNILPQLSILGEQVSVRLSYYSDDNERLNGEDIVLNNTDAELSEFISTINTAFLKLITDKNL